MEAIRQTIVVVELTKNLHRVFSGVMLAKQDKLANRMGANVYQDGKAVNLDGYAVKGYFIRNGTETIVIENGSIHGNQAYVELPGNCYFYEGSYTLTIKLVKDNVEQTLVIFDGQIAETITDAIVENESVINVEDFIQQDWLHRIETAAETALEQASIATESAAAAEEAWHGVQGGLAQKAPGIQIDASGEMVSIADGAEMPVASLITHVEPLQSGSGDPSPDNVRAISGWDEVSVTNEMSGQTLTADLPEMVYGGVMDWTTGVLTVNKAVYNLSSVATWKKLTDKNVYYCSNPADMLPASGWGNDDLPVCSHFVYQPTGTMADGSYKVSDKIYIHDARFETASDFAAWISAESVTFVYPLAEPYTIQLTPQQLETLKGVNNLWSNAGTTDVTYTADTKLYIDQHIAAIVNN